MSEFQIGNLFYLVLLGAAVTMWFIAQNRNSLGRTLQHAMVWGLIFLGVVAAVGLWSDIRSTVLPQQSVLAEQGQIKLPRAPDGHYYLTADVNGHPTRFVVDTGATEIVLSAEDARAAGIADDDLIFSGRAYSANGPVATAPVTLESLAVGPIEDRNLRAWVNEGEMNISLLGMSYLQRYDRIEITDGALVLTR
ncbi:TIGR02281 family clan AA aspartic protease [Lutimaribacter sp. EGI FJ00015]|uniref:TIGR02281 family clan AA aspartic protease n=1 Tax=Lutimaribacter degradans TaxID=2945989 RepID=A0ACC5ZSQ7_9RHOB|nr:TIGR02281 family clan AA aspartic protease [Lutimaribacter sp. EGI FJ00013]MCM2561208.1 TIGR02281 family clan AA aspartic protease [Lutimaribacter sp. EGI FJ00013]MCO0611843.1 TIGR02281 family clan AA aspartic protease [Lutimaribacter sp. EGI FJ00015]MCO0635036.1 TIGR02281 family clan AA aspartic protease [Lutimaribacter sp. EGI FJ00014]